MKRATIRVLSCLLCACLFFGQTGGAQPISSVWLTPLQDPATLRYVSVNSSNPFNYFNFLLDRGETAPRRDALDPEARKLIDYFFLGITLSSDSFWVNLRPDEPGRITSDELGRTDMGKVLLEQDLQLKKDIAKYLHPEHPVGKIFWEKSYAAIGTSQVRAKEVVTSNRVWIVPDEAKVVETEDGAFVVSAKLKVMLENEYLQQNPGNQEQAVCENLMKEIIIPPLSEEINTSTAYAPLRQVYHSLILAEWFKQKHGVSTGVYSSYIDKGCINGLESQLPWSRQDIWQEYVKSYREGEYKKEGAVSGLRRMYWSGGIAFFGKSASNIGAAQTVMPGSAGSSLTGAVNADIGRVAESPLQVVPAARLDLSELKTLGPGAPQRQVPVISSGSAVADPARFPEATLQMVLPVFSGSSIPSADTQALQGIFSRPLSFPENSPADALWKAALLDYRQGQLGGAFEKLQRLQAQPGFMDLDSPGVATVNDAVNALSAMGVTPVRVTLSNTWSGRLIPLQQMAAGEVVQRMGKERPIVVVDVGFGSDGSPTFDLARVLGGQGFSSVRIIGLDPAVDNVRKANEKLAAAGVDLPAGVTLSFMQGDFNDLAGLVSETGGADLILASNVLMYYPESRTSMTAQAVAALTPDGIFIDSFGPGVIRQGGEVQDRIVYSIYDKTSGLVRSSALFPTAGSALSVEQALGSFIPGKQEIAFRPFAGTTEGARWFGKQNEFLDQIRPVLESLPVVLSSGAQDAMEYALREVLKNSYDAVAARYHTDYTQSRNIPVPPQDFTGTIALGMNSEGDSLVFTIQDNGLGSQAPATDYKRSHQSIYFGSEGEGWGLVQQMLSQAGGVAERNLGDGQALVTLKIPFSGLRVKDSILSGAAADSSVPPDGSARAEGQTDTGGIDFSRINLDLKNEEYVSRLNPADAKILRAAKAIEEGWESLTLLYVHEVRLLLREKIIQDLENRDLLLNVLQQLQNKSLLDPQSAQFLSQMQAIPVVPNNPITQ